MSENEQKRRYTAEELTLLKHMQKTLLEQYRKAVGTAASGEKIFSGDLSLQQASTLSDLRSAVANSAAGYAAVTELLSKARLSR